MTPLRGLLCCMIGLLATCGIAHATDTDHWIPFPPEAEIAHDSPLNLRRLNEAVDFKNAERLRITALDTNGKATRAVSLVDGVLELLPGTIYYLVERD